MKISIFAVVLLLAASAHAEVYKCVENGKQVFSDQPCSKDAQKLNVKPASGAAADSAAQQPANASESSADFVKKTDLAVKRRILDEDIYRKEQRIKGIREEMEAKLEALRQKKRQANNNLAGAVWEQSISDEMVATANSYDTKLRTAERELSDLRARRSALN